ncbi:CHASE3 domain-containing protein [Actinomycetospora termitidis]|uniref:CHASE3 domain-containing protein n=1 Tax=Actinomycetospora termitidis TaxID=3053470 RepID=A0ABT7MGD8_9PSEU|nr:CHASE3 domain-containing protein [Actinomycetospora sp. Odt1-22]MDL5159743.1 CHASE3 domain-containing protein [Actinomycetospora sp. Odt1-22]
MARGFADRLGALVAPALRWWERIPIRVQGRITVALPLVAVLISAVLALNGNLARVAIETDIQRKFEMTAALGDLSSLMVNAETGVRGYLLTGQDEFLEPFDQASRELPSAFGRLATLTPEEPGEVPREEMTARLQALRTLTGQQMADLSFQRQFVVGGGSPADPEIRRHLEFGKGLMDRIRAEVGDFQAEQRALLDERLSDINAIRVRDYVSVALALVAALATRFLAWFLFRRGILRRVDRLTTCLRDRRAGAPSALPEPTKRDQMGDLEREVHLLDR